MIKLPTTKIVLISIKKKNGNYPVKLRVTYNRTQRFYPCNIELTKDEFNKVFNSPRPRKAEKAIKNIALGIEARAIDLIQTLKVFDFSTFEKKLNNKRSNGDVYDLFMDTYNELIMTEQVGTAIMYKTVANSLMVFKSNLSFAEITPSFLNSYEIWMLSSSKSITTVGIYLRHLRAIYNKAIDQNLVPQESYPFGRNKYIIPVGNNIKKALTIEEIGKIFNYPTLSNGWERKAKDFWCFSYLCNGMNIMDIANLKYKNIYDGEIHYQRLKTIRTNRGKVDSLISIPILSEIEKVINTWGNKNMSGDNFIFPIIAHAMSPLLVKKKVQQFTHQMNKYTKRIALNLGINKNVTTYVARHSFATVLKRSGGP